MELRVVFLAWAVYNGRAQKEMARSEVQRLNTLVGRKKDSIWEMTKAELVETARMELGVTLAQANKDTVIVLREKLRRNRELVKQGADPLNSAPKGLDRLKPEALKLELEKRGLPIPPKATKGAMILAIRDDLDLRAALAQAPQAKAAAAACSASSDDWDMVKAPDGAKKKKELER